MIKFLLILLLPLSIYASKILSYNIYDRTERVDVMITFDTPYEGVIKQSSSASKIIIKLQDAKIESAKIKKLSTIFLKSISITPMLGYTQIVASVPSSVRLIASKTSDSYGLRLRFTNEKTTQRNTLNKTQTKSNSLSSLPTKKDDGMSQSYYIVVGILILGIIILFFLKRKIMHDNQQKNANPWLFKDDKANVPTEAMKTTPTYTPHQETNQNKDVSIRFQKAINSSNSVVMLDFGEESYLVLMGNSNILLDKFRDDKPTNQEDFESILRSRHEQLDDFLGVERSETKEPLQAYKERAASLLYEEV